MTKHTILFLAANPVGTDRLALDREARAIHVELERSGHRDQFELVTRWAAEPLDLLRELRKLKPTVVHFSGHAGGGKPSESRQDADPYRDVVDETSPVDNEHQHGLFFQGADGRAQLVSTAALEETFGSAGSSVELVVLGACYSEAQAEALLAHVNCVVGMRGSICENAARNFAIGFYGGLGGCESIAAAHRQGCAAIRLEGLPDSHTPHLKARNGVEADRLVLAAEGRATTVPNVGEPRYLIYLSQVKLTMLAQQLPTQEPSVSALHEIVDRLQRQRLIGTIRKPREYFAGKLRMI